jgi:CBS domain-containing protein
MHVATILKHKGNKVVTTTPEARVHEVAELLARHGIGAVLVMRGPSVAGIISERDIVRCLAQRGPVVLDSPVAELMVTEVLQCRPTDTIAEIMKVMTERRVRHLPVVTEEDGLIGIVSIGDVVKNRLDETELEVEALRSYVSGGA